MLSLHKLVLQGKLGQAFVRYCAFKQSLLLAPRTTGRPLAGLNPSGVLSWAERCSKIQLFPFSGSGFRVYGAANFRSGVGGLLCMLETVLSLMLVILLVIEPLSSSWLLPALILILIVVCVHAIVLHLSVLTSSSLTSRSLQNWRPERFIKTPA